MDKKEPEAAPHFSQPVRQIMSMLVVLGLVGSGLYLGYGPISSIFWTNAYLNGAILFFFILGLISCFWQVAQLLRSVSWIERFAQSGRDAGDAPALLTALATLLRSRGARMQLSSSSSRSILETVAQRIDETREITRYIGSTMIFLGLLGTFYGLAITVPALVETIRSLNPAEGESGADIFRRLQQGLENQLGGMGTAFSSSLMGLAGSLIVGLLELFMGHGQNRFYRELEEWLSSITRLGFASADEGTGGESGVLASVIDNMAEQMEALQLMFTQSDISRAQVDDRLAELASAMNRLAQRIETDPTADALQRVAKSQEALVGHLAAMAQGEGGDAESRMRLRSIDVQLLRILEEISAGRQDSMAELRSDIAALTRAVRGVRPTPRDGAQG